MTQDQLSPFGIVDSFSTLLGQQKVRLIYHQEQLQQSCFEDKCIQMFLDSDLTSTKFWGSKRVVPEVATFQESIGNLCNSHQSCLQVSSSCCNGLPHLPVQLWAVTLLMLVSEIDMLLREKVYPNHVYSEIPDFNLSISHRQLSCRLLTLNMAGIRHALGETNGSHTLCVFLNRSAQFEHLLNLLKQCSNPWPVIFIEKDQGDRSWGPRTQKKWTISAETKEMLLKKNIEVQKWLRVLKSEPCLVSIGQWKRLFLLTKTLFNGVYRSQTVIWKMKT